MKRYAALLSLAIALSCPLWTGCGTNTPTKAAQAEQVLITSVNAGMAAWATWVNAGNATQKQIDTVKSAYGDYFAAQQVAKAVIEKAITASGTASAADIAAANTAVTNAETALLSLLNQFLGH